MRKRKSAPLFTALACFALTCFVFAFTPVSAQAKLSIVTTTPNLAWLVKQITQDKANVQSLLHGVEDPHYVDAKPNFILKVANADMVCSVGLSLEIGWLPKVLTKSGNSRVQKGGKGHCVLGESIKPIEKIHGHTDRSQGDVHPEGNPHFSLSPTFMAAAATQVYAQLVELDLANAAFYRLNYESLKQRLAEIRKETAARLAKARLKRVMQYHKEFSYFLQDYGIESTGAIEAVPGSPPSVGQLVQAAELARKSQTQIALGAHYNNAGTLKKFGSLAGIPVVQVKTSLVPSAGLNEYEELQKSIASALIQAAGK